MPRRQNMKKGRPKSFGNFGEIGWSGLNHWGGSVQEEFLPELKGTKARKVFREMKENDPIVGAILFAITMLMRQAEWKVKNHPDDKSEESPKVRLIETAMHDMSHSWHDLISEILTMLPYGWALNETVYKKRGGPSRDPATNSKYSDGLIGWRKMPLRAQSTLKGWVFDNTGGVQGMIQRTKDGKEVTIPIVKSLLFRTESNMNNPEGRSVLRNAYRPWYFKKRIEEIEGIGIERDLAGLPVLTPPEGTDIWNDQDPQAVQAKAEAEMIVRSIRRDEQEGVLLPFGWTLELLSTGGSRSFDTSEIINRYSNTIAMILLADFIILGHNNRYGSFALSSSKTHMFSVAVSGWMQAIAAVFNQFAIPRLLELNNMLDEQPPYLDPGDVEVPDLAELGTYIANIQRAGFQLFPNEPIEKRLLQYAGLPTQGVELGREPKPDPGYDPETGAPLAPVGPDGKPVKPATPEDKAKPKPGAAASPNARKPTSRSSGGKK